MSTKYFALLTQLGADKLANAAALGTKIEITHMAVGDGGGKLPTPDTKQTKLINEKRRAAINTLSIDPKNTNQIIAEQLIPENEGGWWIREIGLYDKDGILIAVGNCAETYKPQLQEGSGRTQTIRMILIVSSANAVTLKVDPSVVLATREYVDDSIKKHANSRNHPDATLKEKGFVILSSAVDSNSETHAATPKAVKAAYDLAKAADNNANGRVPAGRKVNGKVLSADIALNAGDVGAYNTAQTDAKVDEAKALANTANQNAANANNNANTRLEKNKNGADIPNKEEFVKNLGLAETKELAKNAVPNSRKINGKSLINDIVLNAEDVQAFSRGLTSSVKGDKGVPWNAASGAYHAQLVGHTAMVVHFNIGIGSTPALQLKSIYKNGSIAYRSARDGFGFEEDWTEFYTTKNKPSAADVGAYSKEETDAQINKSESQFNQFKTNLQEYIPLPLNLFNNSMMRSVEPDGHPTNYTAIGCTIQAVHPWTKGFEGCYTETAPSNVAPDPDSANENNPYWYGQYYLGARMGRGGLGGGWGGIDSGKILKITSTSSGGHKFFRIPVETYGVFERLGLRFWVKIVKGKLGMGVDNGYEGKYDDGNYYRPLSHVIEKAEADSAQDGWLFVDKLIDISRVTTVQGNVLNFGLPYDEDCEIYLALPYLYVPMANKSMIVAAGETSASPVFTPGKQS
ncbi:phage tail protein [Xenorhabdus sp. BG5]|uniref:phage tail protein n=1 Tax=Xenorhabdus sp. BG5 TaxID=2782014 RepID=UPI001D156A5E|nr:phage tail protein [Xenorhabdus sp. BG5]